MEKCWMQSVEEVDLVAAPEKDDSNNFSLLLHFTITVYT